MTASDEQNVERVWKAIEKIGVGMMVTHGPDGLRARPMQSIVKSDEHAIWFIADRRGHKLEEIRQRPDALLTYASGASEDVTVTGQIEVVEDRATLRELWNPGASTYFPAGPEDPSAVLLRFLPISAEYWSGTQNPLTYVFKALQAKITGERASLGDHATVDLP